MTDKRAPRDMTQRQYKDALAKHGFVSEGFTGYYRLPVEGHHAATSVLNAGPSRRARLAYLLEQLAKYERQLAKEAGRP